MNAIFNWITDWWYSGNTVNCIMCGDEYIPAHYDNNMGGESQLDVGVVNICGESCFSRYMSARARKTKET